MDTPYSNRELDGKFNDIMTLLQDIKVQTTKHNGRMSTLEEWRSFITGGMIVMSIVVIPLLGWALLQIINVPNEVHLEVQAAVQDALGIQSRSH